MGGWDGYRLAGCIVVILSISFVVWLAYNVGKAIGVFK